MVALQDSCDAETVLEGVKTAQEVLMQSTGLVLLGFFLRGCFLELSCGFVCPVLVQVCVCSVH